MHTAEPDAGGYQNPISERHDKNLDGGNTAKNYDRAGTIWDIFRRQDVPKLNEFFRVHSDKFANFVGFPVFFLHMIFHLHLFLFQSLTLN